MSRARLEHGGQLTVDYRVCGADAFHGSEKKRKNAMQRAFRAALVLTLILLARDAVAQRDALDSVMGQLCVGMLPNTNTHVFFQPIETDGNVSVNVWIATSNTPNEQQSEPSPSDFKGHWSVIPAPFGQVAFVAESGEGYTIAVGRDQLVAFARDGAGRYMKFILKCRPTKVGPPS